MLENKNCGISKQIASHRIKAYSDWFYKNHLAPHFKIEERDVFTILEPDNELVKRAIAEHKDLTLLFTTEKDVKENLEKIESELKAHIRFEERELFTEIQNRATSEQFKIINDAHSENSFKENTNDEFWL